MAILAGRKCHHGYFSWQEVSSYLLSGLTSNLLVSHYPWGCGGGGALKNAEKVMPQKSGVCEWWESYVNEA